MSLGRMVSVSGMPSRSEAAARMPAIHMYRFSSGPSAVRTFCRFSWPVKSDDPFVLAVVTGATRYEHAP